MARMARVVAAGVPHHITQRGNNRQDVFLLDDDRRFYLETLRERSQRHGVTLLGYCLMANHVHLVAIPERPDSLARALGESHSRYAQGFNRRYGRTGHLWQNRFYSCPLGRTHLVRALLYVDLNPVRAGLVGRAEEYPWSSALAHTEGADPSGTPDLGSWSEICSANDWGEALVGQNEDQSSESEHLQADQHVLGQPLANQGPAERVTEARREKEIYKGPIYTNGCRMPRLPGLSPHPPRAAPRNAG